MDFLYFQKCLHDFFPSTSTIQLQVTQHQTLGFCTVIQACSIKSWARVTELVNLKSRCFFFFYLVLQISRNYKTRKLLLLPCMYSFSFTLTLAASLLQNLAKLYIWNVKQKDDGVDQNTLHCCYGDYMTTNQQT